MCQLPRNSAARSRLLRTPTVLEHNLRANKWTICGPALSTERLTLAPRQGREVTRWSRPPTAAAHEGGMPPYLIIRPESELGTVTVSEAAGGVAIAITGTDGRARLSASGRRVKSSKRPTIGHSITSAVPTPTVSRRDWRLLVPTPPRVWVNPVDAAGVQCPLSSRVRIDVWGPR